jgi:hypothetical protein
MGERHVLLLREYLALIERLSKPLHEDLARFRPVSGTYSPYGVMYGFSSNIMEHMALKTLQPDAEIRFSLEDVFAEGTAGAERLAWVSGWRRLPHMSQEVQKLYEYPQQFAEDIFERIGHALGRRVSGDPAATARTGRLHVAAAQVPDLPGEYFLSSDAQFVAERQARPCDQARLLADRHEGEFVVSYQTAGGWVAITKDILTDVLGVGRDVKIAGLPGTAAAVLRLMCSGLVAD